jgi:hypothetical protein
MLAKTHNGYGILNTGPGKRARAHRFYYEKKCGPIPDGLTLDHLCRIRACVNPDHLEPVTNTENCRRGLGTKLTPAAVADIRTSDEAPKVLAQRYEISRGHVSRIRSGHVWRDE